MKAMVGMALALSLALIGCAGNEQQGGGGGMAEQTQARGQQLVVAGADAQALNNNLRDATKNASEARTAAANKNWSAAKDNVDEVQDQLNDVAKDINPSMQAQVTEIRGLADKATASVKNRSANAPQDLDKLVSRINQFTTAHIQAGGGKPTQKK